MFNPEEFMNTQQEAEGFETKRTLVPQGEYTVVIEQLDAATVGDDNKPVLKARYKIVNAPDAELNDRLLFDTIWLDVDDRGALLRGADNNIRLGQLLEAVGLNGRPWAPGMLVGQVLFVKVSVTLNKKSGEEENRVTKLAAVE